MMTGFWDTLRTAIIFSATGQAAVFITLLILLALPQSNLRRLFLRVISTLSILSAMAMLVYAVSPIDLVPDGIPVVGLLDDLVALLLGLGSGATGLVADGASRRPVPVRVTFDRHRM